MLLHAQGGGAITVPFSVCPLAVTRAGSSSLLRFYPVFNVRSFTETANCLDNFETISIFVRHDLDLCPLTMNVSKNAFSHHGLNLCHIFDQDILSFLVSI